eukprot:TRINITY_DN4995_c0_g1_i2.p1 TRINITY_DN4995_c0_g1~~TRINITY_DN4995_c0_g1_i2.p1  ORF type:complete len:341 (-),score=48.49 TRINITY_DN4995_c0_g1_i2:282-1304(-)
MAFLSLAAAALWCTCASALVMSPSYLDSVKEKVCISLAAYEDAAWIDTLLENIDRFMEPTTKVALHLNSASNYSDADLRRWGAADRQAARWGRDHRSGLFATPLASNLSEDDALRNPKLPRMLVADERIEVRRFEGSVLGAHIVNAKVMEERWPGECDYFLMQASNMMWVRKGAEDVIREHKYSNIVVSKEGPYLNNGDHSFTAELSPHNDLFGWSPHEGSFYPMKAVNSFVQMFDSHNARTGQTLETSLVRFQSYFEESWLQTYILNFDPEHEKDDSYPHIYPPPMCYRVVGTMDNVVTKEDVEHVNGAMDGFRNFYAVKRVSRSFDDPAVQYIMALDR